MRQLNKDSPQYKHYALMRQNQITAYVRKMKHKWGKFDKGTFSIKTVFGLLDDFVDLSDPDTNFPNKVHMFQTAQSIRNKGLPDWLQLTGLIHDLGKIMCKFGKDEDGQGTKQQWGCTGDTFAVGTKLPDCLIAPELNKKNVEDCPVVYSLGCGLSKLHFSFGHDEYLYMVLSHNENCKLPKRALDIIRYHSCYALHSGEAYKEYLKPEDATTIKDLKMFQGFDLYTKTDKELGNEALQKLWPYYEQLIKKYCPGELKW